jgi:ketosteroid isomerase-like protein
MHTNEQLIHTFYEAFARRDAEAMAACYHDDIVFSDPAFGELRGKDAGDMWRMLVARGKDLEVKSSQIKADDAGGSAHWDATYTFSATGRKVLNRIDARFEFRDGKIVRHQDTFDLYAWMKQALGPVGLLLGWSGFMQGKIRGKAVAGLREWQARPPRA